MQHKIKLITAALALVLAVPLSSMATAVQVASTSANAALSTLTGSATQIMTCQVQVTH